MVSFGPWVSRSPQGRSVLRAELAEKLLGGIGGHSKMLFTEPWPNEGARCISVQIDVALRFLLGSQGWDHRPVSALLALYCVLASQHRPHATPKMAY